jgi:hypothetical protein
VIPVNQRNRRPGERAYPTLFDVPERIDIVDAAGQIHAGDRGRCGEGGRDLALWPQAATNDAMARGGSRRPDLPDGRLHRRDALILQVPVLDVVRGRYRPVVQVGGRWPVAVAGRWSVVSDRWSVVAVVGTVANLRTSTRWCETETATIRDTSEENGLILAGTSRE